MITIEYAVVVYSTAKPTDMSTHSLHDNAIAYMNELCEELKIYMPKLGKAIEPLRLEGKQHTVELWIIKRADSLPF